MAPTPRLRDFLSTVSTRSGRGLVSSFWVPPEPTSA